MTPTEGRAWDLFKLYLTFPSNDGIEIATIAADALRATMVFEETAQRCASTRAPTPTPPMHALVNAFYRCGTCTTTSPRPDSLPTLRNQTLTSRNLCPLT